MIHIYPYVFTLGRNHEIREAQKYCTVYHGLYQDSEGSCFIIMGLSKVHGNR